MKPFFRFLLSSFLLLILLNNINYSQWVQVALPNVKVNCLTPNSNNTILFAGTDISGIYASSNNGDSWQRKDNGVITSSVNAINTQTNNFLAGTSNGLFDSQDAGNTWKVSAITGLTDPHINAIYFDAFTNAYLGTNSGVFFAQNNSPNLTARNSGLTNLTVNCFAISLANMTEYLWCGTNGGLFVTTNQAQSWSAKPTVNNRINAIYSNPMLFYASNVGIYSSANFGTSFVLTIGGLDDINLLSLCLTNINNSGPTLTADLFAGTGTTGKVFYSNQWGNSWKPVYAGLKSNNRVNCLAASGAYIIAGTDNGIWRRTLVSLTSVDDRNNLIPANYSLENNYPNPFNPSTTIRFELPKESQVTLKIYDLLGREVATLVNEKLNAGQHEATWKATSFSTGTYFYRLQAGEFSETKKLVLLK